MREGKELPAVEKIRWLFRYEPTTGKLFRRTSTGERETGSVSADQDGYQRIVVGIGAGTTYVASRVIWVLMTGEWPKNTIDHKNRDSLDNRWENLREATLSQQKQNNGKRKDSKTGFKCVEYIKRVNRYRWSVTVNGKRIAGPHCKTAEEAYADYLRRLSEWHGEFANVGA